MKRLVQWLFIIFILLPVAGFLILWAILELTPQAKWRAMAEQEIGRRMHRRVDVGPVHLGLRGLAIEELRLSDVGSRESGSFLKAEGVSLGWDLRSLWQGFDFKKKTVTRSSGNFHVNTFHNPHYSATDLSIHWALTDIDPSGSHLNGWATLEQGTGLLENIDRLVATSASARIALTPVTALMNLQRMGVLKLGLPDLRHWPIQGVHGRYSFINGRMTLEHFVIESHELNIGTTGAVQLASGNLQLDVQLHSPPSALNGALDAKLRISGTTGHPQVNLDELKKKAFKATIHRVLEDPQAAKKINNVLNNLFH